MVEAGGEASSSILQSFHSLFQRWIDHKLTWDPTQYDNISFIYVPADMIWTPDIVLYNT